MHGSKVKALWRLSLQQILALMENPWRYYGPLREGDEPEEWQHRERPRSEEGSYLRGVMLSKEIRVITAL